MHLPQNLRVFKRKNSPPQGLILCEFDGTGRPFSKPPNHFGCKARLAFKHFVCEGRHLLNLFGCKARLLFEHFVCEGRLLLKHFGFEARLLSKHFGCKGRRFFLPAGHVYSYFIFVRRILMRAIERKINSNKRTKRYINNNNKWRSFLPKFFFFPLA